MASQTEAPDDLIAELARLMADDAKSDQATRVREPEPAKPVPIRIPGAERVETPKPVFGAVRIPGNTEDTEPNPYNFDFALNPKRGVTSPVAPVAPKASEPAPTPTPAPEPVFVEPTVADAQLDHDALADLIAAELASDLAPSQPLPVADGPPRGEDNFGVPPVFGLGTPQVSRPAPAPEPVMAHIEPQLEPEIDHVPEEIRSEPQFVQAETPVENEQVSDPLADIERLIAPAVYKAQSEAPVPRAPSPALRSLATPTLPVVEPQHEPQIDAPRNGAKTAPVSVDEAILAAASATGARVEWVDSGRGESEFLADDELEAEAEPRRRFTMSRAVMGPLVAIALLGVAGGGLYWVLGQGGAPSGPAPLLVADTNPVKETPDPVEPTSSQSVVFNEISGANNPADEQLVPRDQADVAALNEAAASSGGSGVLANADGTGIDPNQDGLVNRKVRTVTVRPDGTIISGADSMAGSAILPVERPDVPTVPGADVSTPDLVAATEPVTATPAATTPAPVATTPPVTAGSVVPVVDATGAPLSGRTTTIPSSRPADFAQAAAAALSASAVPATPVAAPATAQPAAAAPTVSDTNSGASAFVQLASQRSEEAARQSAQSMNTRYGVLFGGAAPEIQRVDLGERGIYYRVLVPAASRDAAASICTNIRAAGGDCLLL